ALSTLPLGTAFAKGGPESHLLGPTGIMGETSKNAIKVTKIDKGSPADGMLKAGDIIVAAGGKNFQSNARLEIAAAIDAAEGEQAGGKLKLTLKDKREVELPLQVLGTYSATAPYDCAKTNLIVSRIAERMIKDRNYAKGELGMGWLGLMATGDPKHLEIVKNELPKQDFAQPKREDFEALLRGEKDLGYVGWYWGYALITLCEYQQLTGDKSVLPAIEAYAVSLARGQDAAGTWGHRMATAERGKRLPGYSHINQPSLSCLIGLVLAEKCGVGGKEVSTAIDRCLAFFHTFVGEGAIPYGVHDPNSRIFNNNGSSAMAGIAMNLRGDKKGAEFFSRQAATSYDGLESGHASYFFNVMWTPLGAAVAGPEVTQGFFPRARWLHTLYRSWDDRFTYNGSEQKACNSNGALLLAYCLPRQKLWITGKNADPSIWAKGKEAKDVIGMSHIDYPALSPDELLGLFGHPAPQLRRNAVWELRKREGDFTAKLVAMLETGSELQKRSAIDYYGYQCPDEIANAQIERIGAILRDTKQAPRVRVSAAGMLACRGQKAYAYYDDILRFIVEEKPYDPMDVIDKDTGPALLALCPDPRAAGLIKDKNLYYAAARKLARNKRQNGRDCGMKMLRHMPLEDFHLVAEEVRQTVINSDPTFHSYHNPQSAVQEGVFVLADLNIRDGLDWAMQSKETPWGKGSFKIQALLHMLTAYGPNAKEQVDKFRADPEVVQELSGSKWKKAWDGLLKAADSKEPAPKLISFEEAIKAGKAK
ncbi:MAG TPA: DUF6288 domain-containing protein, partial [Luteolibacter sp.]|nr:DUF6288 domain-containing protein [Luteolibacter sp.]